MNCFLFITIFVVGLSGIIVQVLLLRELLVSFYGNELTLGIILANWLLAEALGVLLIGKLVDRIKNKVGLFISLECAFLLVLPIAIFLSRVFKNLLGIPFAEAIGLSSVFFVSLLIILPVGFCHGALFSASVKLHSLLAKRQTQSIGKVYAWETIGTIAGAAILTYLFIPYLNSFRITFIVSLVNLIITAVFLKHQSGRKHLSLSLIGLSLVLILSINPDYLHKLSVNKQWQGQAILDYRNSVYGNITVTKKGEQNTFFYNGSPIITVPYPDITFTEEFGNLPLLFHPKPQDILIVGAGAGGLINEVEKHAVAKIDYAELDPLLISILKKYPAGLIDKELSDRRVNLINLDGRLFLNRTTRAYDLILVGLSRPSDLSVNRVFSNEFFSLAKKRLKQDGIIAIWLPGSLTYISRELRDLNACIINAMKNVFGYVRLIPGDYNIILASDSAGISKVTSATISGKIKEAMIKTNLLTPAYLDYRLNKDWLDWFDRSCAGATKEINRDSKPIAVFEMLIYWNKQFSVKTAQLLEVFRSINSGIIFILVAVVTLVLSFMSRRRQKIKLAYTITTTGFFGMLMSLILIFSFQVFRGYLYHVIGLLIGIFMAGTAAGSIFITGRLEHVKKGLSLLIWLEVAILLFSSITPLVLTKMHSSVWIFPVLFFASGALVGLEFPLVTNMYLGKGSGVGRTTGIFYAADLIGGWFAGILGGIIFLPVLGLFQTCLIIAFLKLSSIFLLRQNSR